MLRKTAPEQSKKVELEEIDIETAEEMGVAAKDISATGSTIEVEPVNVIYEDISSASCNGSSVSQEEEEGR